MIFDSLANLRKYPVIPHLQDVCKFIKDTDVFALPSGDISILGEKLFVKVLRYTPKQSEALFFETHEHYADIQIIFKGTESMQVADIKDLEVTQEFKLEGDFLFYKGTKNISELVVSENKFVVFFPGEAHKPGCTTHPLSVPVFKLVFKVLFAQ